jgi:hypothetical protein
VARPWPTQRPVGFGTGAEQDLGTARQPGSASERWSGQPLAEASRMERSSIPA